MRVHVVSFSPSDDRGAVGGLEWRYKIEDAKAEMVEIVNQEEGLHNLALVHLDVPDGLSKDEITSWIDSHLELIEPRGNH